MKRRRSSGGGESVDELVERGFTAISDGDLEQALTVAARLRELRHSSCFELEALAHEEAGDRDRALAVLDEGLGMAPGVWVLWQLRGNILSDTGDYDEARASYEEALRCGEVDRGSVLYNLALAEYRQGELGAGLATLDRIGEPGDLRLRIEALRAGIELAGGDEGGARARIEAALAGADPARDDGEAIASLHVHRGELLVDSDPDAARREALAALELDTVNDGALFLLREVDGADSTTARDFELLVAGEWTEQGLGFLRGFQVRAEDEDMALALCAAVLPPAIRDSLRVEECKPCADELGHRTGVYAASPYVYFDD
ncbi:MAG: tetratricopeptide repeat protein [Planctomycetota bacterium]